MPPIAVVGLTVVLVAVTLLQSSQAIVFPRQSMQCFIRSGVIADNIKHQSPIPLPPRPLLLLLLLHLLPMPHAVLSSKTQSKPDIGLVSLPPLTPPAVGVTSLRLFH